MTIDRANALQLLKKYTKNRGLFKHMLAVEAAMRAYAKKFNQDKNWWGIVGLLHDFDYEKYPDPKDHPFKGTAILKKQGYEDEFINTILAHAPHTKEPRNTLAKKTIFAVDELTGLIVATALVKPNKSLAEVDVRSIKKKMKDKAFARQINRQEIIQGTKELNTTLDEHIEIVLKAMQLISKQLEL